MHVPILTTVIILKVCSATQGMRDMWKDNAERPSIDTYYVYNLHN